MQSNFAFLVFTDLEAPLKKGFDFFVKPIFWMQSQFWLISMVDEKTNPNYVSLLKYVIYYIMSAEGTNNVIYYVREQGQVIWMSFFMHHGIIIAIKKKSNIEYTKKGSVLCFPII